MGISLTHEEAIANLSRKFPNLDFSKFEFKDRKTDSIIICPKHGEFELNYRLAYNRADPCPLCRKEKVFNSLSLTKEEVIEKVKNRFPGIEILDFDYKGYDTLITLVCPEHGESVGTVENFLYKRNRFCPKCPTYKSEYTTESAKLFIKEKFPNVILRDDFKFEGTEAKFTATCKLHGEFETTMYKCRVNRNICIYCSKRRVYDPLADLVSKHPELDFSKFEYKGAPTNSTVICSKHGEFQANYSSLTSEVNRFGCLRCAIEYKAKKKSLDQETAIANLTKKYPHFDFSKFVYKTHRTKSTVICPIHGEFQFTYGEFMHYKVDPIGCKKCSMAGYSKKEKEIVDYIKSIYNGTVIENDRSVIPSRKNDKFFMELDIYLPELNLAIEFNGSYWHSNDKNVYKRGFKSIEEFHNYKTKMCNEKNINLLHISEHDYDINKEEIFKHISELIVKKD